MKYITVKLTDHEAYMISKALAYNILDEDIGKGEYPSSWLAHFRRINKKLREAGAPRLEEE